MTAPSRWRALLARSARVTGSTREISERGIALLGVIFFMILVAGLAVVLLTVILSQTRPTLTAQKNTRTVYSAQAGLQAALGLIRTAADSPDAAGRTFGEPSKLPCSLTARVTADDEGASYSVAVGYFTADPAEKSDEWRAANQMTCSELTGLNGVPKYAYIESSGEDSGLAGHTDSTYGDRYLSAIYKFKVSNPNIPGGIIYNADGKYCLQAKKAKKEAHVNFVPASTCTGTDLQLWIYSSDYQLQLASTTAEDKPGLCITGPADQGNKNKTQKVKLQPCRASNDDARWNQLWSWTGDYSWKGQQEDISKGPSDFCLSPDKSDGSNINGGFLYARNGGCNGTFAPSAEVGAGAAGYETHQIVNYKEFGRCTDVTNEQIGSGFMISYPCKQDPTEDGKYLLWNHKWYYSEPPVGVSSLGPQHIYINHHDSASQQYCLTTAPADGKDVTFTVCNTTDERQNWTRVYDAGDYASSYLFIDNLGRCMGADPSDPFNSHYSKVRVSGCDGSLKQKWNAPPNYTESTFGNYRETAK